MTTESQEFSMMFASESGWANFANRIEDINQWGIKRNILAKGGATALTQIPKLLEEIAELKKGIEENNQEEIKDGVGDGIVVLVQICRLAGVQIDECLEAAWADIKDRTGCMFAGVFVKQKDLDILNDIDKEMLKEAVSADYVRTIIAFAKKRHTDKATSIPADAPRLP